MALSFSSPLWLLISLLVALRGIPAYTLCRVSGFLRNPGLVHAYLSCLLSEILVF